MSEPTMSEDLVERVARAIHKSCEVCDDWDSIPEESRDWYLRDARAALAAMPQPEPIAWMTAHLWPEDGEWTIRQLVHWTEAAARANADRLDTVVALVPVEVVGHVN